MVEYNFVWRYTEIYAIIETGGKQYRVTPGQTIDVERLDVVPGNTIDLDKVLLIADGEKVTVGQPTIVGAKVVATVERQDNAGAGWTPGADRGSRSPTPCLRCPGPFPACQGASS